MLINAEMPIPFPRPLVYITYRDKLGELVPYIPNVRSVEVNLVAKRRSGFTALSRLRLKYLKRSPTLAGELRSNFSQVSYFFTISSSFFFNLELKG